MSILEGCPICGGSGRSTIPFNRDQRAKAWLRDAGLPEHYQWFLCQSCGNAYQRPSSVPAVARRFWETHTHDHENSRRGADTVYEAIAPHLRGATMLDVGCGLGYLVRRFTDAGWDAFGIDPTPAHKAVHESLGVLTAIALAEEFEPGRRFDAILSCYAIYFVSDPVRFLQGLKGWLLPQGRLCIVISDFLASRDPGLPSYAHSFYPTADSMRFLLATAGFRVERSWGHRSSLYFVAIPSDDVELPNVNVSWTKLLYRTKRIRYQLLGKPIDALIGFASGISRRMRLASNAAHPRFFLY